MNMTASLPKGFACFADEAPQVEPRGEVMQITIADHRYVLTRHNLLKMVEGARRACAKQDAQRAEVITLKPAIRRGRKAVQA